MAGIRAIWMVLLVLCPAIFSLPLPEERDSEDSRKVLGSSVVTSVSVVLDDANGNGTATAHFADAAGRPVGRPAGAEDIGSPVGLLTPDRYQFFTFDADGNLVKRYMTKDEVRSIIANGQKKGETPTFYHNAPTGEGVDAAELVVGHVDEHDEQLASQLKVHRVVESVQNVLKSQLASAPASEDVPALEDDLPGAPDPGASWSMILPSYLGNVGDEHESPPGMDNSDTASTESLMVGDAPVASTETGSGETEHEDVTEAPMKTEELDTTEEEVTATSVSSEATEQATQEVTEQATEQVQEEVKDQEQESEQEKEQEQEKEKTKNQEHEQAFEQVTDQEMEHATEQQTEEVKEQVTEHVNEQEKEQAQEQATELVTVFMNDVPEDVSEGLEGHDETTTLRNELKESSEIHDDVDADDAEDMALPTTETSAEDVPETTLASELSSSSTEEASSTPSTSANPIKISITASADTEESVVDSEEMHADAPVGNPSSSSEEGSGENASTEKQGHDKVASPETPEANLEDSTTVTDLTAYTEATTDTMEQVELLDAVEDEEEVPIEEAKEKESLVSIPFEQAKEKESLEAFANGGDSSASMATSEVKSEDKSEDKSANNMVDTTSTLSSEVHHPSDKVHDTKENSEENRPETGASEAVSVEKVAVQEEAINEVDEIGTTTEQEDTTADSEESTEEIATTTLSTAVERVLTNATLMDLNVTQTLGDALSFVLHQVARDALAEVDVDADAEPEADAKVVKTSVSSSHSAHSTSTSVSSSQEAEASPADAASVNAVHPSAASDNEEVERVEVLSPAESDDTDKVKRHNKPGASQAPVEGTEAEEVGVERVAYSPVALIHPEDSKDDEDSEDVATQRPSSTEAAASAEFIPISDEHGAASGEDKRPEEEDVTAKAGSGDGGQDTEGSGDDNEEGSGDATNNGALPALYNVSDADFGLTPAMTTPTPTPHDALFPRDSSHEPAASTAGYDASTEYDVHKYVAGDLNHGLPTSVSAYEDSSEENSSMYDVNKYTNSDTDLGVTTPSNEGADELNDASVSENESTTEEQSGENSSMYDVNKYANSDTDLGVTTPSHKDADELNDASVVENKSKTTEQSGENSSMYDVNKYANSDTDLGVTTPSHKDADELNDASVAENKSTTTEQSGENSSMYDVNKYANSDTDLGLTTPSTDADVEVLNDEGDDLSAENIFDVNNYVVSDKDLGVTKSSTSTEDSVDHSSDAYDVNKYVNSDIDLGLTTPLSEVSTELTPSTSQEAVKSEEATTTPSEGSAEGSTTPADLDLMLNDDPHDEDDNVDAIQLFKSPLAGVAAPNWTPVAVISPHDTTPGVVDLRPAPGESLGLEASTANLFEDVHNFAALCNELAFRMWLSATGKGVSAARSLVMSPFAITSLLSMIFLGAKGPTSGQMNDILRLDDMMTFNPHQVFRNVTESLLMEKLPGVATAAFVRQLYSDKNKGRMLDFYKQRASGFYDGHVEEVDFSAIGDTVRRRTNMLVKKQTGGKIGEYMRGSNLELQPPLAAFGANVFQTDCSSASSAGRDGEMYFTVLPATRHRRLVPVPAVVYRTGFLAGYEPSLDATVVSLGGGDADVSTLLVLPGQQGQLAPGDGLPLLEARLFAAPFADAAWSKLLRSLLPRAGLEVQLPRFSHRSQLNMTHSLQGMGLNDLFDPLHADLKGLSGSSSDLHVSDIVQINTFSTCAEAGVGAQHHVEIYPGTPQRAGRDGSDAVSGDQEDLENVPLALRPRQARIDLSQETDTFEESVYQMPLALRPRQAREPEEDNLPRLKFDRPFLYFVRHNPTGFILHMGRFNPRLLN